MQFFFLGVFLILQPPVRNARIKSRSKTEIMLVVPPCINNKSFCVVMVHYYTPTLHIAIFCSRQMSCHATEHCNNPKCVGLPLVAG